MAEKFKRGDRVRLNQDYMRLASAEVKKTLGGILTITVIDGEQVHLSNGKSAGTTGTYCTTKNIYKVP